MTIEEPPPREAVPPLVKQSVILGNPPDRLRQNETARAPAEPTKEESVSAVRFQLVAANSGSM